MPCIVRLSQSLWHYLTGILAAQQRRIPRRAFSTSRASPHRILANWTALKSLGARTCLQMFQAQPWKMQLLELCVAGQQQLHVLLLMRIGLAVTPGLAEEDVSNKSLARGELDARCFRGG